MVPGYGGPQGPGPGHAPHHPPAYGMDPTMVPGMGGPPQGGYGQVPPGGHGPPQGGYGGQPPMHPGAQHVPQAPAQPSMPDDFAASLDRAIALETNDSDGPSGGVMSGAGSGLHEPDRVDLRPGDSAHGDLMLDRAIEDLEGPIAPIGPVAQG